MFVCLFPSSLCVNRFWFTLQSVVWFETPCRLSHSDPLTSSGRCCWNGGSDPASLLSLPPLSTQSANWPAARGEATVKWGNEMQTMLPPHKIPVCSDLMRIPHRGEMLTDPAPQVTLLTLNPHVFYQILYISPEQVMPLLPDSFLFNSIRDL